MERLRVRVWGGAPFEEEPPQAPVKEKVTKEELQALFGRELRPGEGAQSLPHS